MMANASKFMNGDMAVIHSTNSPYDSLVVTVVGITMAEIAPDQGWFILERADGSLFETPGGDWKCILLTQHCLTMV